MFARFILTNLRGSMKTLIRFLERIAVIYTWSDAKYSLWWVIGTGAALFGIGVFTGMSLGI
jgi:hypothetical protein